MLILFPDISTRIKYIFSLLIKDIAGIDFDMTTDRSAYNSYPGPKFAYSTIPEFYYHQQGINLLFEKNINSQDIEIKEFEGYPSFFEIEDERSLFPFDIFAASFYLVTRFEEYLPFKPDKFGRFPAELSLNVQKGFIHLPLVNIWGLKLRKKLLSIWPEIEFRTRKFSYIPTIDIDHAYAYKLRSVKRVIGGYGRSLVRLKFFEIFERTGVLLRLLKDPYDNYSLIRDYHKKYRVRPLFFILFAHYGGSDNNVSLTRYTFKSLLRELDKQGEVGIHPSVASSQKYNRLEKEIHGLSLVLDREINISRQHFLKFKLPATYRNLMCAGIKHDFSMGYASVPGFRAAIATPFHFFDVSSNMETTLVVHPVMLMDVTLRDYLRLTPENAIENSRKIIDETKKVDGEFISLWHNESLSNSGRWRGWRKVYESVLQYCTSHNP